MLETIKTQELSKRYSRHGLRRLGGQVISVVKDASIVGLTFAAAQWLHVHPDAVIHLPAIVPTWVDGAAANISNSAHLLAQGIHDASDVIGGVLEHIPYADKLPKLAESRLPLRQVVDEHSLTTVEGYTAFELGRRLHSQIRSDAQFRQEHALTEHIPGVTHEGRRGMHMRQKQDGFTLFGRPGKAAEKALANPSDSMNQARIKEALRSTIQETYGATKPSLLEGIAKDPRIRGQMAAEAAEQASKIILPHLAKEGFKRVLESIIPFVGPVLWAMQYKTQTKPEAEHIGSRQLKGLAWVYALPVSFIVGVNGIVLTLANPILESKLGNFHQKVYRNIIIGMDDLLNPKVDGPQKKKQSKKDKRQAERARIVRKLVNQTRSEPAVTSKIGSLHSTVSELTQMRESSPLMQRNTAATEANEKKLVTAMQAYDDLMHAPLLSRLKKRHDIKQLEKEITRTNTTILGLMKERLMIGDYESQLARALVGIYYTI